MKALRSTMALASTAVFLVVGCSDDPTEPTQPPPENQAPVATIVSPGQNTTVTVGEAVVFAGTASDADGTVASHEWNFGDGSRALVEDPGSHTYATAGTYTTTYTVTDNDGATSGAASVTITVVESAPPLQGGTWLITSLAFTVDGITNFLVTFDSSSLDITRIEYTIAGTTYDYDATAVTGAGSVSNNSVVVNASWQGGLTNSFRFDGTLVSSGTEAVGSVNYNIAEPGVGPFSNGEDATMTKQP